MFGHKKGKVEGGLKRSARRPIREQGKEVYDNSNET